MTLIAACRTWSGICIATDTRVTHIPKKGVPFYKDDCRKCEIITGGLALAVAGDCRTSSLFKDILKKNYVQTYQGFAKKVLSGETLDMDPTEVLINVTRESLIEVSSLNEVTSRPAEKTRISGLIAAIDLIPLKLNAEECSNIIEALKYAPISNDLFLKNAIQIYECAAGKMDSVEIQGCRQSTLIAFNNVLFGTTTKAILDVHEVPFGQVAVYGSGVSDDHAVEQYKTLAYLLLKTPADDLETAAFHLTRTHGWSDQVVKADVRYGFKTFGGATLAMALIPDPKDPKGGVDLILIKGEFNRKSDGKVISNIFKNKDGEICAKGEDGKTSILKPFSQYGLGQLDSLQLAR